MENKEKKIALVTGAGRGIGRAIAKRLARDGIFVLINYCSSGKEAEEVLKEIRLDGGDGACVQADVSDFVRTEEMAKEIIREYGSLDILVNNAGITRDGLIIGGDGACVQADVSDFVRTEEMAKEIIREYGSLDILVNNAGITRDGLIMRMTEEDFDRVLAINLKGCFHTIRHLSRYFVKQRYGRIINIASVVGIAGNAGQANYSASKAGIIGLTKSVARELAGRGITVNAVAPGFIETEMTEVLSDQVKERAAAQIPMGKFGKAEDVAEAVAFLASDRAAYITGQVLQVDGGMVM